MKLDKGQIREGVIRQLTKLLSAAWLSCCSAAFRRFASVQGTMSARRNHTLEYNMSRQIAAKGYEGHANAKQGLAGLWEQKRAPLRQARGRQNPGESKRWAVEV